MPAHTQIDSRRRGSAAGWIVVAVLLAALVALVAWKVIDQQNESPLENQSTTQPESPLAP